MTVRETLISNWRLTANKRIPGFPSAQIFRTLFARKLTIPETEFALDGKLKQSQNEKKLTRSLRQPLQSNPIPADHKVVVSPEFGVENTPWRDQPRGSYNS